MMHPLITKDPVTGGELIVTRLECPESNIVIEGRFSLGWMARLTPEQLAFVGQLVKHKGNVQKLSVALNIAYNTARNHLDDIIDALEEAPSKPKQRPERLKILAMLSAGELPFEAAMKLLTNQ
ncbi:MAG: DUF2089 domain-containing protein [Ktedonobacteraceae bacterium]